MGHVFPSSQAQPFSWANVPHGYHRLDVMETKTNARELVTEVNTDADGIALPADVLEKLNVQEGESVYLTIYTDGSAELHVFTEKEREALADAEEFMDSNPTDFKKLAE